MMDFPASPAVGATYAPGNGLGYVWDGTSWNILPSASGDLDLLGFALKNVASVNGAPMAEFRNKLINGDFAIGARTAVTYTGASFSAYQFDRWLGATQLASGSFTITSSPHTLGQTLVPGNPAGFCRIIGAAAVAAANGGSYMAQRVEDVRTLQGKKATISFWAKCSVAKVIGLSLVQIFGTGGSPSADVYTNVAQPSLTTAWQKFTYTVQVPPIAGKTIGSNLNSSMGPLFIFGAKGTFPAIVAQPGALPDLGSDTIDISHVSMVDGDATLEDDPFTPRHIRQEIALCHRYFYSGPIFKQAYGPATATIQEVQLYPVQMRVAPGIINAPSYTNASGLASFSASAQGYYWQVTVTATGMFIVNATFTADAEL